MTVLPNGREAAANAIKGCGPQPSDLCRILEAVDAPLSTRKENKVSTTKTPEKTISHRFIFPAAFLMVTNVLGYFSTFSPLCPWFFFLWLLFSLSGIKEHRTKHKRYIFKSDFFSLFCYFVYSTYFTMYLKRKCLLFWDFFIWDFVFTGVTSQLSIYIFVFYSASYDCVFVCELMFFCRVNVSAAVDVSVFIFYSFAVFPCTSKQFFWCVVSSSGAYYLHRLLAFLCGRGKTRDLESGGHW